MAGPRRRAREIALQVLHQMDVGDDPGAAPDADAALARYFAHLAPGGGPAEDDDDRLDGGLERRAADRLSPSSSASIDRALVDELVRGVATHRASIDDTLAQLSRNWRLERMAVVERNVIRIALYELQHCKNVPVSVVINEAIELAKRYGTAEGTAFVNGLLDRAAGEIAGPR